MGFYVNLEMPKDCPMCPFAYYDIFNTFCGCDITRGKRWAMKNDKDYAESSTRPDWCPLIEVPEPHGRLGDLDALPWYLANEPVKYSSYEDWEKLCDAIKTAPTVIPASEEGET